MGRYDQHGWEVVGAGSGRALLIRVKNVADLVKAQGGAAGALFQSLAPDTIEKKVYATMKDELAKGLADKGVKADVQIVESTDGLGAARGMSKGAMIAIGVGVTGTAALAYFLLGRRRK